MSFTKMILSPYQQEKLRQLRELKDPNLMMQRLLTERAMAEAILKLAIITDKGDKGEKGDKGDSIKGDKGERGDVGMQGEPGRDGVDGKNGLHGKNGVDGKDGKDGKPGKDGIAPTLKEVTDELRKTPISYKEIADAPDLKDLPALIEFLKRGGFRGGAGNGTGSVTIYSETPSGLIDGVNKTYTTTQTITTVIGMWYNGEYIHPAEYTISGAGFTMSTALPVFTPTGAFTISYT